MSRSVSSYTNVTRDDIQREIDSLTRALERLKTNAASESQDRFESLRDRVEHLWNSANFDDTYSDLSQKTRKVSRAACEGAREHPLSTALIGLGVAAVVGWLVTRR
ncbi:ElaB/YgaM/YqjD family protein [Pseudomonas sp. Marseille-QA0892]